MALKPAAKLDLPAGPSAAPQEGVVTMALGTTIPASLYTLPRLWEQLKTDAQYAQRLAQVDKFNKSSIWLKRGLSMTPCRCDRLEFLVL